MHSSAGGNNNNDTINILSHSNFLSPSSPSPKMSMDELWKDIILSSLTDHPSTAAAAAANNPGTDLSNIILQDFLGKPFNKKGGNSGDLPRAVAPLPSPVLSLTTASDFECIEIGGQNHRVSAPYFEGLGSPVGFPSFCKKRVQEINENFRDRRHKRMMKNRESAARSRARKQAYTNELEFEITHLQKENARLKRQQEKLLSAPTQLPKKNTLQRSLSAPF